MSDSQNNYDLIVLGGGTAGYAAALRATQLDMKVALIERDKVGGTCLHRGCVPTKALLHVAEVADSTREASVFGIDATLNNINVEDVLKFKSGITDKNHKGLQGLIKMAGIDTVIGEGKLTGKDTVTVSTDEGDVELTGKNIVLATGSTSRTLGIEIGGNVLTSTEALNLDRVPKSAIVLGGGVIGVEFASIWNSFGSDVTIVEGLPNLVANEDASVSKGLERAFKKRKIKQKLGVFFKEVEQTSDGVKVSLEDGTELEAEVLLVAVGRGPVTEGFGFEEQGVKLDRGFVTTNDRLHTGVGNIYAAGDIVPGLQLAHRSFAHGIFIAEEIAGKNPAPLDETGVPRITYCDPEIFSVGLTEKKAAEKYGEDKIEKVEFPLAGNAKSAILNTQGFIKIIREKDGPIVGVHGLGARLSEQAGEAQLIVNWEAFPEEVASLIHGHPTQNEAIGEAALALAGKPLHFR
ncbi:dihydrolipoyl dehydrogenase [Brevibacterium sp. HMSC08F02]|uniref:dihydrolipoyl dehydrogenase n=1 Tax=unclassified Brevibacterium TaxID=2614124 RepID=UPI0008A1F11C|nr:MULTISPECIES: dihydrolipoyl dehydrogenase [unclassified Brevibacterium]OFT25515.1 dihydrolipoyl dehydrogenase [Brevibacterium sp. HMSC08F02]OFT97462.1 dihydrolipoyl dehydrogenase [Brevibacterium sp. HMSC22B09]